MYLKLSLIFLLFLYWSGPLYAQNNPSNEVTIEVNTVQIILNDEHRGGVDWGAIVSDFHTGLLKKEDGTNWDDKKYRLSFGTVSQDDYAVLLDALDTVGRMSQFPLPPLKVALREPNTVTLEKQNIHVDVLLTSLKPEGAFLHLTPHVSVLTTELHDGRKVPASVELMTHTDVTAANNTTIVIGGLMKEEEITKTRKFPLLGNIPLLGDIPIVGLVFRSQGHLVQKTETIIFLTVRSNAVAPPEAEGAS